MLPLHLRQLKTVLCLGAHADDIEIGCGATVEQLTASHSDLEVHWVVFSGNQPRQLEAQRSAETWLKNCSNWQLHTFDFPDGFFPNHWADIKREIHQLAGDASPDLVFTHRLEDRHQDHRVLGEIAWQAFRNQGVLEYEIPKYEGDLGQPNLFVPVSHEQAHSKIQRLVECFGSQADKPWFDEKLFEGHLRMRGVECHQRYAEAFTLRKGMMIVS